MRLMLIAGLAAVCLVAIFGCGSDSDDGQSAAATGTALRREQAIAQFTAEAATALITMPPTPTPTPTPTPRPVTVEDLIGSSDNSPSSPPTPDVEDPEHAEDIAALKAVLLERSRAMSDGDFDAWYETCSETVRDEAIENNSLGRQLKAMGLEPDGLQFEFVLENALFTGGTSATVIWGWRAGPEYYPGVGGGPYVKEEDRWYSIGWGCVG